MNMLTDPLVPFVRYKGKKYKTKCSFDNVLEVQRMYKDRRLEEAEKAELALAMLTRVPFKVWLLNPADKAGLLDQICKEQIELPRRPSFGKQIRTFDFALDSPYIYASFMQEYGIDLVEQQGRLHWKKFIALFQGLSEKTKIREIMHIRGMDVPEATQYNQKQRQNILELKSYYALPAEGEGGQKGLDALFSALEKMA